jgi:hypothetical protein
MNYDALSWNAEARAFNKMAAGAQQGVEPGASAILGVRIISRLRPLRQKERRRRDGRCLAASDHPSKRSWPVARITCGGRHARTRILLINWFVMVRIGGDRSWAFYCLGSKRIRQES